MDKFDYESEQGDNAHHERLLKLKKEFEDYCRNRCGKLIAVVCPQSDEQKEICFEKYKKEH
jgi:hypothetical protein